MRLKPVQNTYTDIDEPLLILKSVNLKLVSEGCKMKAISVVENNCKFNNKYYYFKLN